MINVIANPESKSGKCKRIWDSIVPVFQEYNEEYKVYLTDGEDSYGAIISEIMSSREGDIHILVAGGDGTLNCVLQHIKDFSRVIISILPTGSSNDLARAMGISGNPSKALRHIFEKGISQDMDLGTLSCSNSKAESQEEKSFVSRFLVSSGLGYDAFVCEEVNKSVLKRMLNKIGLGRLVYFCVAIKSLARASVAKTRIILDGDGDKVICTDRLLFLVGMNNKYEGGGFMFAPFASNRDGLIDMCIVSDISKFKVMLALPSAFFGHMYNHEGIYFYRCRSIQAETSVPLWVHTDGETKVRADKIEIRLDKEKVRFLY